MRTIFMLMNLALLGGTLARPAGRQRGPIITLMDEPSFTPNAREETLPAYFEHDSSLLYDQPGESDSRSWYTVYDEPSSFDPSQVDPPTTAISNENDRVPTYTTLPPGTLSPIPPAYTFVTHPATGGVSREEPIRGLGQYPIRREPIDWRYKTHKWCQGAKRWMKSCFRRSSSYHYRHY
ncbi:hypothetical protein H4R33_007123 [Dimargaris cristalligena]|uniref:Uncharacterized protein n=1 Tax=Dimargaris cristalligena TaxID=215637 RepID=A0A4P9ZVQ2_9FUNG|nr:hypothetical protein H4R33_007123 [Dimargaris cristalligena]RKP37716.1 hypothetical protein BJ085DRAFT_35630 [Dimargaris cristalligena]|eukprot:RKP37716.1 hypothetical protein BJ085DRAFT_35630 [Dimargaris cristalligena]